MRLRHRPTWRRRWRLGAVLSGLVGGDLPVDHLTRSPSSNREPEPSPTLTVNGTEVDTAPADGWWVVGRQWNDGDEVVLVLPVEPRFTVADPRLDASRGAVAV